MSISSRLWSWRRLAASKPPLPPRSLASHFVAVRQNGAKQGPASPGLTNILYHAALPPSGFVRPTRDLLGIVQPARPSGGREPGSGDREDLVPAPGVRAAVRGRRQLPGPPAPKIAPIASPRPEAIQGHPADRPTRIPRNTATATIQNLRSSPDRITTAPGRISRPVRNEKQSRTGLFRPTGQGRSADISSRDRTRECMRILPVRDYWPVNPSPEAV